MQQKDVFKMKIEKPIAIFTRKENYGNFIKNNFEDDKINYSKVQPCD